MTNIDFTAPQAAHALEVVSKLMRERRFFLHVHDRQWTEPDPGFGLHSSVFNRVFLLDLMIRSVYANARKAAEEIIAQEERDLGIAPPTLEKNQSIVQCNRYTGGLDICAVYPLSTLVKFAAPSINRLMTECLAQLLRGKSRDEIPPKLMRESQDKAARTAARIWSELQALDAWNPLNTKCIVLLKTRHSDNEYKGTDRSFMPGQIHDLQEFPFAVGYLVHAYSRRARIVRHSYIVSSTSADSHVQVAHWDGAKPQIMYDHRGGYSCDLVFATVL